MKTDQKPGRTCPNELSISFSPQINRSPKISILRDGSTMCPNARLLKLHAWAPSWKISLSPADSITWLHLCLSTSLPSPHCTQGHSWNYSNSFLTGLPILGLRQASLPHPCSQKTSLAIPFSCLPLCKDFPCSLEYRPAYKK